MLSTLGEKRKTTLRKLIEAIAPLYSIYNVDFGKLAEEHELGIREDVRGKVSFLLAYQP